MKQLWMTGVFVLGLTMSCWAQMDLKQLYDLRDKSELLEFIGKTEAKLDPADVKKLKMLGIAYHNLATLKMKGASAKAAAYLQKAYALSPHDDEVLAFLGSSWTMVGRDSWNVLAKTSDVNQGIKMIDQAVAQSPDNIVVRTVRMNNSLEVPAFFNRKDMADKDLQYLKKAQKETPGV